MMKRKPRTFFLLVFAAPSLVAALSLRAVFDWNLLAGWLIAANLMALLLWLYDKIASQSGRWRVPESALHMMSILGATPAAFIGMKFIRHKTMKLHFAVLYGVLFILQIALLITWSGQNS